MTIPICLEKLFERMLHVLYVSPLKKKELYVLKYIGRIRDIRNNMEIPIFTNYRTFSITYTRIYILHTYI